MALHAVDDLADALTATRRFLLPPDRGRWLRLAVVVFLVGGFGSSLSSNVGSTSQTVPGGVSLPDQPLSALPPEAVVAAVSAGTAVVVVGSALLFFGSVMEFVLVASLRDDEVRIRRYVGRYWRQGLRLFGFRVVVSALSLATVAGAGALAATTLVAGPVPTWTPDDLLTLALVAVPTFVLVSALSSLVQGFTTAFVVPVMLAEGRTVLGAWRRFWPTLRGQPRQYGAYALVAFVLTVGFGVASGALTALGALLLAVPFVAVGVVALVVGSLSSPLVLAVLGLLAVVYVVVALSALALVQVPLRTYMRYYTLFVLGDTNPEFDLLSTLREDVRA